MFRYLPVVVFLVAIAVVAWAADPVDLADDAPTSMPTPSAPPTVRAEVINFPAVQAVGGSINVANLPEVQQVAGLVDVANLPEQQEVVGTVAVSNLPSVQEVAGTVAVSNLASGPPSETILVHLGLIHFDPDNRDWQSEPFDVGSYAAMSIGIDRDGEVVCSIAWQWFDGGPFLAADTFASNMRVGIVPVRAPRARVNCNLNGAGPGRLRSVAVYLDRELIP